MDPVVYVADENPSAMSLPSVSPRYEYDQSGVTVAEVPALSPLSAVPPESALLAVPATVTPPEAEDPQREDVVLPSS